MKNWEPVDYIVFALALTIAIMLLAVIMEVIIEDREMSEGSAKRVNVVINGVVAIISLYVGAKLGANKNL